MIKIVDYPLLVFVLSFLSLSLSEWVGKSFKRLQPLDGEAHEGFSIVQGATLTLLALLIGFSFSMATGRYDQRKNYEEAEANAIGTEYVRVGILPAIDPAKVRGLLLNYLDQRVLFYDTRNREKLSQINIQTDKLQTEMWAAVEAAAIAQPGPVAALVAAGMNDVLNSQSYTQAALWNRIPGAAWALMVAISVCANVMVGFSARAVNPLLRMVFPLVVSIALLLIADIDCPRGGLIRVIPQNLISLSQSLHAQ
jgi:hypothetical protein